MKKSKKKKTPWTQWAVMAVAVLLGVVFGLCGGSFLDAIPEEDVSPGKMLLYFSITLVAMYAAAFVQTIIHEGGHLLFGLLSGYRFSSFRIMSFMWIKEGDKLKFRRLSIAGTGGQCLMTPPELLDGNFPVFLYNLGGSFLNIISGIIFLVLHHATPHIPIFSAGCLLLAVIGFAFALLNGIPIKTSTIDNDGHNALSLRHNREARRAFWVQLTANSEISRGVRLKDMPEEWFVLPDDTAMKNSLVATMGVFACGRLMDAHQFEEADRLMAHLLELDSGITGLHRSLMICDRIYVELITQNRQEIVKSILSKEQKKFMKSMKNFPSVLRTEYTYALLAESDHTKAEKIKTKFEKCAKTYPYPVDIQSERELMALAEKNPA